MNGEAMMPVDEARRRVREAFQLGKEQAVAELAEDLRLLAGEFAMQLSALRSEMREALGLPPLPEPDGVCVCDRDGPLQ